MDIKHSKNATLASLTAMFLTLALLIMAVPNTFADPDTLIAPHGTGVTVDAIWSTGEWDDAPQYTMIGNQTSYIRAKYDGNYLYVLIDIPWDTTDADYFYNENSWLAFDTAHDGGTAPQTDDYLVCGMTDNTDSGIGMGWQGDDGWEPTYLGYIGIFHNAQGGSNSTPGAPRYPMTTSPNSGTPHRVFEMQVPLALIGSPGSTVGFYANVDDESSKPGWPDGDPNANATAFSEWPSNAGGNTAYPGTGTEPSNPCPTPDNWGDLVLQPQPGTYSYEVMGGMLTSTTQMGDFAVSFWEIPFGPPRNASPYFTPAVGGFDLTFGSPDGNGVVPITVPHTSWKAFWHCVYEDEVGTYFNVSLEMYDDGFGWLFTQANADVDIHVWNDDDGMYWTGANNGHQQDQAILPVSIGVDGLAGTSDDGFGDGDLDPAGSSIIFLNVTLNVHYWSGSSWDLLIGTPVPSLMTTEDASDVVDEAVSDLDGFVTGTVTGEPWEYINSGEPWANDKSNYYATYACCGSVLGSTVTFLGEDLRLDLLWKGKQVILRSDCEVNTIAGTQTGYQYLMGDGTTSYPTIFPPGSYPSWKVGWQDLFTLAGAYGAQDERGPGMVGGPKPNADANYDARFDLTSTFGSWDGKIGWQDLFALAGNYGNQLKGP